MIDEAMAEIGSPEMHEQAREVFRQSLEAELPLTGDQLGEMFSRSGRWGRARIAEVKSESEGAEVVPISGNGRGNVQVSEAVTEIRPVERQAVETPVAVAETVVASAETVVASAETERHELPQRRGARAVSWVAFIFGVVVSVAANVAHTFHPSSAQLEAWQAAGHLVADWSPEVGSMIAAAFWPIALLLAVEVLTRVRWRRGFLWNAARFGGTGAVALVAALMSYRHMAGLLASYGEDWLSAHAGPLAVDGLMIVAGFALLSMGSKAESK